MRCSAATPQFILVRSLLAALIVHMFSGCQTIRAEEHVPSATNFQPVSCADLRSKIDSLRHHIGDLTARWTNPHVPSNFDMWVQCAVYLPLCLTAAPILSISAETDKNNQLKHYEQELTDYERAYRELGCNDEPVNADLRKKLQHNLTEFKRFRG
jgi:hypothetical protein